MSRYDTWLATEPVYACESQEELCEVLNEDADECKCDEREAQWEYEAVCATAERRQDEQAEDAVFYALYGDE